MKNGIDVSKHNGNIWQEHFTERRKVYSIRRKKKQSNSKEVITSEDS